MDGSPLKTEELLELVRSSVAAGTYQITQHTYERMAERGISEREIRNALSRATRHIESKNEWSHAHGTWKYVVEGETRDGRLLRIVLAFADDHLLPNVLMIVITAIGRN